MIQVLRQTSYKILTFASLNNPLSPQIDTHKHAHACTHIYSQMCIKRLISLYVRGNFEKQSVDFMDLFNWTIFLNFSNRENDNYILDRNSIYKDYKVWKLEMNGKYVKIFDFDYHHHFSYRTPIVWSKNSCYLLLVTELEM